MRNHEDISDDPTLEELECYARQWLEMVDQDHYQKYNPPFQADTMVRMLLKEIDELRDYIKYG